MAALDDGNVNITALYREVFNFQEKLGGLQTGYAFLREVTESNRRESLAAQEKLTERMTNGFGQLRAELKDEMSQQERRHIDALKSLEERIAGSIDKLAAEVSRAVEKATQANTGVAVVSAQEDAAASAADAKVKLEQIRAPVTQTLLRWMGIIALAVIAGREGVEAFAQFAGKF